MAVATHLPFNYKVVLVESEEIGTIGVGEATIPPFITFNQQLGINLNDMLKATSGTIKLGIDFRGWGKKDDQYVHYFGDVGIEMGMARFFQYWLRAKKLKPEIELDDYIFHAYAFKQNKFNVTRKMATGRPIKVPHAYHLDATKYGAFLRRHAEMKGVTRIEGKVTDVNLNAETGYVESLLMENKDVIKGDIFLDCTGSRALLIEGALKSGFESYSKWLFNDRALAVQTEGTDMVPGTRSTAHEAGWQWRIPLQHRTGNGHVYSSRFMSDDAAEKILMDNVEGDALMDPKLIRFETGRRKEAWKKNVVAIGLSGGFLEPLESTSIHLIQTGIMDFIRKVGNEGADMEVVAKQYNQIVEHHYNYIRDFIVAHYTVNQREEAYWKEAASMELPDSLKDRLDIFQSTGFVRQIDLDLFKPASWETVLVGQNMMPKSYVQLANTMNEPELLNTLEGMKAVFKREADAMMSHKDYIAKNCTAEMAVAAE